MSDVDGVIEQIGKSVSNEDYKSSRKTFDECMNHLEEHNPTLSDTHVATLRSYLVQMMETQHNLLYARMILEAIMRFSDAPVDVVTPKHPMIPNEGRIGLAWDYLLGIMKDEGILLEGEQVEYNAGSCMVNFGGSTHCHRIGPIYLTNRRLIIFGEWSFFESANNVGYRIYNEEVEVRPILGAFDLLEYDRIHSLKSIWKFTTKCLKLEYRTKYIRFKNQTLYGPLFFRFELGTHATVEEGDLEVRITGRQLTARREYLEALFEKINEKLSS